MRARIGQLFHCPWSQFAVSECQLYQYPLSHCALVHCPTVDCPTVRLPHHPIVHCGVIHCPRVHCSLLHCPLVQCPIVPLLLCPTVPVSPSPCVPLQIISLACSLLIFAGNTVLQPSFLSHHTRPRPPHKHRSRQSRSCDSSVGRASG